MRLCQPVPGLFRMESSVRRLRVSDLRAEPGHVLCSFCFVHTMYRHSSIRARYTVWHSLVFRRCMGEHKATRGQVRGRAAPSSRLRCIAGCLILVAAAQLLAKVSQASWLVLVRDQHPGPKVRAPDGFVSVPVVHARRQARVSTWQPANDAARVPGSLAPLNRKQP